MEHTINLLASKQHGFKGRKLDLNIYWDEDQNHMSFPVAENSFQRVDVPITDITEIVSPTADNVKQYDASWDYYDLTAYTPTGAGVLFGVFGLVGESLIKGHPVHFIICMKSGANIFCKMASKGYEKLCSFITLNN